MNYLVKQTTRTSFSVSRIKLVVIAFFAMTTIFTSCKKDAVKPPTNEVPPVITDPKPVVPTMATVKTWLVDKNATDETAALFYKMKTLAKTKTMFGQQDATKEGKTPGYVDGMSDIKEVTGVYPAVYGWDLLDIAAFQRNPWFDNQSNVIRKHTVDAYLRGGVNTYSWHYWNPILSKGPGEGGYTEGYNAAFYYQAAPSAATAQILPGGNYNEVFNASLDRVANYIKSIQTDDGKLVPIIFRPFHEMDGDWFWWGKGHSTVQEYKELFQYTVKYLRDTKKVRNVLFSWSPDRNWVTEEQYLAYYPGDEYVDILGTDNYEDLKTTAGITAASNKLKIMSDYAIKKNKVAALTETGLGDLGKADWYTQILLKALTQQKVEISYALVWTNGGTFFTPIKGHPAEADFIKFKNSSQMVFGDKVKDMYKLN